MKKIGLILLVSVLLNANEIKDVQILKQKGETLKENIQVFKQKNEDLKKNIQMLKQENEDLKKNIQMLKQENENKFSINLELLFKGIVGLWLLAFIFFFIRKKFLN